MKNYVYVATSLDGYIAKEDGNIDWLNDISNSGGGDFGFGNFMAGISAVIMGRNTFEQVLGFGVWTYTKPVFVLSSSLEPNSPGCKGKDVTVISGSPEKILHDVHERGFSDLYIDGGKVIQSFLEKDLIDEIIITRIPIALGSGISLFGRLEQSLTFTHVETEVLNSSLVKSRYTRNKR